MRRHLLLAALLLAVLPVPGSAQLRLLVGGGVSAPSGSFGDVAEAGYHVQAGLQVQIPTLPLALRGDGGYHHLGIATAGVESPEIVAGSLSLMAFLPGNGIQPYFFGGYGSYRLSGGAVLPDDTVNDHGYHGGFGVAVGGTGFSGFAEIRYVMVDGAVATRMIPFTLGFRF